MRGRCRQHRLASLIFLVSLVSSFLLVYLLSFSDSKYKLALISTVFSPVTGEDIVSSAGNLEFSSQFFDEELGNDSKLRINGFNRTSLNFSYDVLVFLHIQKTAGTYLGSMIVNELDVTSHGAEMCVCHEGKRKCDCMTDQGYEWIFSRYSTGWRCGLHADWTELTACVETEMNRREKTKRRRTYHYTTFLREPKYRYMSEFLHVQRGATWKTARLFCGGRSASDAEWPRCFSGPNWRGVDLHTFASCSTNLASNRQTRMLADLHTVHCYNRSAMSTAERNAALLDSARSNLARFAYFGLTEFLALSQFLFESTFVGLHFRVAFAQEKTTHSHGALSDFELDSQSRLLIARNNRLDDQLYAFASRLFFARVRAALLSDAAFRHEQLFEQLRDAIQYEQVRQLAVPLSEYVHRRFLSTRADADATRNVYGEPEELDTEGDYEEPASAV